MRRRKGRPLTEWEYQKMRHIKKDLLVLRRALLSCGEGNGFAVQYLQRVNNKIEMAKRYLRRGFTASDTCPVELYVATSGDRFIDVDEDEFWELPLED